MQTLGICIVIDVARKDYLRTGARYGAYRDATEKYDPEFPAEQVGFFKMKFDQWCISLAEHKKAGVEPIALKAMESQALIFSDSKREDLGKELLEHLFMSNIYKRRYVIWKYKNFTNIFVELLPKACRYNVQEMKIIFEIHQPIWHKIILEKEGFTPKGKKRCIDDVCTPSNHVLCLCSWKYYKDMNGLELRTQTPVSFQGFVLGRYTKSDDQEQQSASQLIFLTINKQW